MGCNSKPNPSAYKSSKSLIVLPNAEGVKKSDVNGTIQLFYHIKEIYPASKSIALIEKKLKSLGWTHLEYDDLNFNVPTAHVTGWRSQPDTEKGPGNDFHIWYSIWKNQADDYVKYHFQYFSPTNRIREQDSLFIAAILVPSKVADKIKTKVKTIMK